MHGIIMLQVNSQLFIFRLLFSVISEEITDEQFNKIVAAYSNEKVSNSRDPLTVLALGSCLHPLITCFHVQLVNLQTVFEWGLKITKS